MNSIKSPLRDDQHCECGALLQATGLLLFMGSSLFSYYAAAACTPPVSTSCPSALQAAQALTGNRPELPISNAAFSGVCDTATDKMGMLLVTTFGDCHYLSTKMSSGAVVLSNGNAAIGAVVSNDNPMVSTDWGVAATDTDLLALSTAAGYSQTLHDQAVLSFDITPTVGGPLAFQYVFGSEEYPFFAPSAGSPVKAYNDIFGFYIWSVGSPQNVALLPNTSSPVSIATVNPLATAYYIANHYSAAAYQTELNGFTAVLKTSDYTVTAGTTYHIKLAIADGKDGNIDSAVWVKAGSVRFNIKDCVGSWISNGNCTGTCAGGNGTLPEIYSVTVTPQNGGNDCPIAHGTTRSTTFCTNNNPCPVNCTGSWVVNGNCTGVCGGGLGFTPEMFIVTSPALHGGSCSQGNGTTRLLTACTNNQPCPPRNCVGSWVPGGPCNGVCGGGAGLLPEKYVITTTAAYNGTQCPATNGTTRTSTACNNTAPCPVNCVGGWIVPDSSNCTGHCSGGAGFTPEVHLVTQINLHGGTACLTANGTTRLQITCNNTVPCPPVHCVGVWLPNGLCNGTCGGGSGIRPEIYNITTPSAYGGNSCSFATGDTQEVTPCTNSMPCPINCVGNWTASGTCTGACEGGNGTLPEAYAVSIPAQFGGAPCPYANGQTRSVVPCTNNAMCPVNCVCYWQQYANCTGSCGNGTGTLPERFIITAPALYGGSCPRTNGSTRSSTPCINYNVCPPVNCVGSFVSNPVNTCNGTCGGGAGWQRQVYTITTAAAWGGNPCPQASGTQQWVPCNNTQCCPVNCVGSWMPNGPCNGACSGGAGKLPERWIISVPSSCSGTTCPVNGTTQLTTNCTNTTPCPPVHCIGSWVSGQCNGTCGGGTGLLPERYVITNAAAFNGTQCPEVHNTTKMVQPCNNTTPCPVHCVGNWSIPNGSNCTGACDAGTGAGAGFIPELYVVTQAAMHNGTSCPAANNTWRQTIPCNNTTPCPPQNCVGNWVSNGACYGGCWLGAPHDFDRTGGILPQRYAITTPALRNGTQCPWLHGALRENVGGCINFNLCSPKPCNATWITAGACNGACGGGSGLLPERYHVYSNPVDYGTNCTHANGTTRLTTSCSNSAPCPISCAGSWLANGSCIASCNNGTGTLPEVYRITVQAQHGGAACVAADGDTRNNVTVCINYTPCPVSCVGSWQPANASLCNGTCGGGPGYLPETYIIESMERHGGAPCPHTNATVQYFPCNNTQECPIDCAGLWIDMGLPTCSALCDNGSGFTMEYFNITQAEMYEGLPCLQPNGTTRQGSACINATPCAINCVGSYLRNGNCTGTCATNGQGVVSEVYVIIVKADHGGSACPAANGSTRAVLPCVSQDPCPCVGEYIAAGACNAMCGGTGILPEWYFVSKLATFGGQECPVANGTVRFTTTCTNNTICPWSDVVVADSAPVLPPLNMTLNDSDIVIKGGNVTITGIKIEGVSGFSNSSVSAGSFGVAGANTSSASSSATSMNGTKPVKPRVASFNGTLGFYTFGISVEVLGEFELQRSMAWTWDTKWSAWTTQVAITGTFVLTKEEIVNNVTVALETMKPTVSGYLNLFSSIYPGPGFSGNYDWAGKLELNPDPFTEWGDAVSLVLPQNGSAATSGKRRSLLGSTGMVPVQGRVGVRESKTPLDASNSSPGSVALDDTGDIMIVCQDAVCMAQLQLGQAETGSNSSKTYIDDGAIKKDPNMRLIIILLAVLVAPVGVALCSIGIAAAVIYKRRRQKEKEDDAGSGGKLKRLHKHQEGAVAGRENNDSLQGSSGVHQRAKPSWRSADGSGNIDPIAMSAVPAGNPLVASAGPAELERLSITGSSKHNGRQNFSDENGSTVQCLRPGETGFGSMPGGYGSMVTLPPAQDSVYGGVGGTNRQSVDYVVPGSALLHTGSSGMWHAARRSLAGSLAGMANALAHPFSRSHQAGDQYRAADPPLVQSSGPSFFTMFSTRTHGAAHIPSSGVQGLQHQGVGGGSSVPEEIVAHSQHAAFAGAATAAVLGMASGSTAAAKQGKSKQKTGADKKRGQQA